MGIDWARLEQVMRKCMWGYVPTRVESRALEKALDRDPDQYKRRHDAIKAKATRALNPMATESEGE